MAGSTGHCLSRHALAHELGYEDAGTYLPVTAFINRTDVQLPSSTCARHVEQASLFEHDLGWNGTGAYSIDAELIGVQGRAARSQIRPRAVFGSHHPDFIPFQPLGPMSREDADGIVKEISFTDRLGWNLLLFQDIQEHACTKKARVSAAESLCGREQGHDRVDVVTGRSRSLQCGGPQSFWPPMCRPATCPQSPQDFLG